MKMTEIRDTVLGFALGAAWIFGIGTWIRGAWVLAERNEVFWAILAFGFPPYGIIEGLVSYF